MAEHKNNRYENSYVLKDMILNFKRKKKKKKKLSDNPASPARYWEVL